VRQQFESQLGAGVIEWSSQEEGFSPGVAARCKMSDGRKLFIKAVSGSMNTHSLELARQEVSLNRALPAQASAPAMIASLVSDDWVAAAWVDIAGRQPGQPWSETDLQLVLQAVDAMHLPAVEVCPTLQDDYESMFNGWRRLVDERAADIAPWIDQSMLERLAEIEATGAAHYPPEALIHGDLRADNLLIDENDTVWLVDWASGTVGPRCFDLISMIPSIAMSDSISLHLAELWERSELSRTTDSASVDALVVAIAGYFVASARQPPIPEIPMLRDFQQAQAVPALAWVYQRLGLT